MSAAPETTEEKGGWAPRARGALAIPLVLIVVASVVLFRDLGARSLLGDESIYAQAAREAGAGAVAPLEFEHQVFAAKPPLNIWATAAAFRLLGVGEWSARCVDALLGVGLVLLLYWAGRRLFGRLAGGVAALLPLTARYFVTVHGLRDCVQESALVFLMAAALTLYLIWRLPEEGPVGEGPGLRRGRIAAVGLLLGAAMLVKSPVPLLALGAILPWEMLVARVDERWRSLRAPVKAVALAVAVYLPWPLLLLASMRGAYFEFLRGDLLERAGGTLVASHARRGVYGPTLYRDFGGWLVLVPLAVALAGLAWRRRRRESEAVAFLLLWAATVIGFFFVIPSRNEWYIYPAYPALALMMGYAVHDLHRRLARRSAWLAGAFAVLCLGAAAAGVLRIWRVVGEPVERIESHRIARYLRDLGHPRVCQDRGLSWREWDRYYLRSLVRAYSGSPGERCDYILTNDPAQHLPFEGPGRRCVYLRKLELAEPDVALVSVRADLPVDLLAFSQRRPAALWGMVTLEGSSCRQGPALPSRWWTSEERLHGPAATGPALGYPDSGAVLRYRISQPSFVDRVTVSYDDAWLPGTDEVLLVATGVSAGALELTVQPWPTAMGRSQSVGVTTRSGRVRRYELPPGGPVRLEIPLSADDLRSGAGSSRGWAPLRVWAAGWTPLRELPGAGDFRRLGIRLLRLRQGERSLWQLPEAPPETTIATRAPSADYWK